MIKSKLKRRLRKKFHSGEFQEFGFEVLVNFKKGIGEIHFDKFLSEFIDEIESSNLQFGGGGDNRTWQGFVASKQRFASPSADEKSQISIWLENRSEVEDCKVGEFLDSWNDSKWNN